MASSHLSAPPEDIEKIAFVKCFHMSNAAALSWRRCEPSHPAAPRTRWWEPRALPLALAAEGQAPAEARGCSSSVAHLRPADRLPLTAFHHMPSLLPSSTRYLHFGLVTSPPGSPKGSFSTFWVLSGTPMLARPYWWMLPPSLCGTPCRSSTLHPLRPLQGTHTVP